MGKLYTLDQKLLTNTPEIRIGEKIYPIDDRTKTVMKVTKMDTSDAENISKILELALGKPAAKEVDEMNLLRCLSETAGNHHCSYDRGGTGNGERPISGSHPKIKLTMKSGMISNLIAS